MQIPDAKSDDAATAELPTEPAQEDDDVVLLRRAKALLRSRARALRNTIPAPALAARSDRIVQRLLELPEMESVRAVASFWPILQRNEVDLRALHHCLSERNVRVYYPQIDPDSRRMTFREVADTALLEVERMGFAEPPISAREAKRGEIDVLVVPALALDASGHRLGYGAGFYDRAIPDYAPPAKTVGAIFDFQLLAEVPTTPHDVKVETIVTDLRVVKA